MAKNKNPAWASESEMLVALSEQLKAWGFKVYPETGGHDLLAVVTEQMQFPNHLAESFRCLDAGDIIAIEGKLQSTMTLLRQLIPPYRQKFSQPSVTADFYVGVVPSRNGEIEPVLDALGAHIWQFSKQRYGPPALWVQLYERHRCYGKQIPLPDLVVDLVPGKPSPRVVTPWKLAAVRFCLDNADGRDLMVSTFKKAGLRQSVFLDQGWARQVRTEGRKAVYQLVEHRTRPDVWYPEIVAALKKQEVRVTESTTAQAEYS